VYLWFGVAGDDAFQTGVVALKHRPVLERLHKQRLDWSLGSGAQCRRVHHGHLDQRQVTRRLRLAAHVLGDHRVCAAVFAEHLANVQARCARVHRYLPNVIEIAALRHAHQSGTKRLPWQRRLPSNRKSTRSAHHGSIFQNRKRL